MILAGDIGATHTRLALFDGDPREPVRLEVYPTAEHAGLEEMLDAFLSLDPVRIHAAGFGVAGPVRHGHSVAVNLPWEVDAATLARRIGIERVAVINDLDANARGLAALSDEDFAVLGTGTPDAEGNAAVLSAGTGLGQAVLARSGDGYRVIPGEGGHVDFAPVDELQVELWRHLSTRFGHVSLERILSGHGIENLYSFVLATGRGDPLPGVPDAAAIAVAGLDGSSEGCGLVLELFVAIYGAAAGNVALTVMATAGVFLGGGIAPKVLPKLEDGAFLHAFRAKGRFAPILHEIPVKVVINDRAALIGAGLAADQSSSE